MEDKAPYIKNLTTMNTLDFLKLHELNTKLIEDENLQKFPFAFAKGIVKAEYYSENSIRCQLFFNVPFRRITIEFHIKESNLCDITATEYLSGAEKLDFEGSSGVTLENVPSELFKVLSNIPYDSFR